MIRRSPSWTNNTSHQSPYNFLVHDGHKVVLPCNKTVIRSCNPMCHVSDGRSILSITFKLDSTLLHSCETLHQSDKV